MTGKKRQYVTIIVYEGGVPVAKWKLRSNGAGTDIEQTALVGFQPYSMAANLMMIVEALANEMWQPEISRLAKNLANDAADEQYLKDNPPDDGLPF